MFSSRSTKLELLDAQDIPQEDLFQNLRELDFINQTLGGHDVVLRAIKKLLVGIPKSEKIHILEIGSGGGDNLRALAKWGIKNGYTFQLTGVDLKQTCTDFATQQSPKFNIHFITTDYRDTPFRSIGKPDIIFNSLFCHHFNDSQLVQMMRWMLSNANIGYTICDLHRHPIAYFSIKILTKLFSRSYLVKNDAPLSVKRGFKKSELLHLINRAKQPRATTVQWAWAFRWIVTVKIKDSEFNVSESFT